MAELCSRCQKELTKEYNDSLQDGKHGYKKVCEPCYIEIWDCKIHFIFDHELPTWVEKELKTKEILENLRSWFWYAPAHAYVHFVSRKRTETLEWQYMWLGRYSTTSPRDVYSYRGFCGTPNIVVIVDDLGIETPDSVKWVLYHELGHLEFQTVAKMSDYAMDKDNRLNGREFYNWKDDSAHEADSEEQHVNKVATAFMEGKSYDRHWWRKRVNNVLAGKSPDWVEKKTKSIQKKK